MKVILTEKLNTLGNIGEIVNVSAGHARNYLIPNRLAVLADEKNQKQLEHQKKVLANKMQEQKEEAEALKAKLDGVVLELVKKVGANGRLFGTVTTTELSKELAKKDISVEKRLLTVDQSIKSIGSYTVKAKLYSGVDSEFLVKVIMDAKQAEELKAKQIAAELKAKEKKKATATSEKSTEEQENAKTEEVEMTDDEKLTLEANKILRS